MCVSGASVFFTRFPTGSKVISAHFTAHKPWPISTEGFPIYAPPSLFPEKGQATSDGKRVSENIESRKYSDADFLWCCFSWMCVCVSAGTRKLLQHAAAAEKLARAKKSKQLTHGQTDSQSPLQSLISSSSSSSTMQCSIRTHIYPSIAMEQCSVSVCPSVCGVFISPLRLAVCPCQ